MGVLPGLVIYLTDQYCYCFLTDVDGDGDDNYEDDDLYYEYYDYG